MYVVDTNVISEPTKRSPSPHVLRWLAAQGVVALCAISVMELEAGVGGAPEASRARLAEWLEALLGSGAVHVLPVDEAVARVAGRLRATTARSGRPRPLEDLLIGATALAHGAVLATRNVRDFQGLGLSLVSPFEPSASVATRGASE